MTDTSLQNELRLARDLAREAGRVILDVYATEFQVHDKGGGEGPVTEADRRANTLIVAGLRKAFPRDGIVAEESKDNSDASQYERCWYIDPLDGTREFVARNGEFAVHVGLAIAGEARLGVVYKPVDERLYSGLVDGGATLEIGGKTSELHVSTVSAPAELRLVVSRSNRSKKIADVVAALGIGEVFESGSVGVKVGLLCEQKADVYLHLSKRSSRWDACAPEALLRAAGGLFTDLFGDRYRYDGRELENARGLIGANPAAFAHVRPVVERIVREAGLQPAARKS